MNATQKMIVRDAKKILKQLRRDTRDEARKAAADLRKRVREMLDAAA